MCRTESKYIAVSDMYMWLGERDFLVLIRNTLAIENALGRCVTLATDICQISDNKCRICVRIVYYAGANPKNFKVPSLMRVSKIIRHLHAGLFKKMRPCGRVLAKVAESWHAITAIDQDAREEFG